MGIGRRIGWVRCKYNVIIYGKRASLSRSHYVGILYLGVWLVWMTMLIVGIGVVVVVGFLVF